MLNGIRRKLGYLADVFVLPQYAKAFYLISIECIMD